MNLKGIPTKVNGQDISKSEYDRIASYVQEQLYNKHKKSNILENVLLYVPRSNDLIFVKNSYYDSENNLINNSNLEYIKVEEFAKLYGMDSLSAENIMNSIKEMVENDNQRGYNTRASNIRKYRQLARKKELQHLGIQSSPNASSRKETLGRNSKESTNDRKGILENSRKTEEGKIKYSVKKSQITGLESYSEEIVDIIFNGSRTKGAVFFVY